MSSKFAEGYDAIFDMGKKKMELIRKVKELSSAGKSFSEIAVLLGKSVAWVESSLLIMDRLPSKVHDALASKLITRTTAIQLLLMPKGKENEIIDALLKMAQQEGKI